MGDLGWIDDFLPTEEGIALKEAREAIEDIVTLKEGVWRFIHGHPVLLHGPDSGGGSGGGGGKPKPGQGAGAVIPAKSLKPTIQSVNAKLNHGSFAGQGGVSQNTSQHKGQWTAGHPTMTAAQLKKHITESGGKVHHVADKTDWKGRKTGGSEAFFDHNG